MASVFYSVPETFRGRFRTDTSRRPYPIPQVPTPAPALPVRTDTLPIRRLDTQPPKPPDSRQHTLPNRLLSDISPSQTTGTPHTPKAKPPVFRQTLHPSDCSPFIHRHPAFPAASTCLPIPQTPRHRNRPDTAPQTKPARCRSRSRQSAHHLRTPDAPIRQTSHPAAEKTAPLIARYSSVIRTATDCQSDCPPPPHFSPCFIPPAPSSALSIRRQTAGRTDIPPAFPRRPTHGYPSCFPPLLSSPYASFPEKVVPLSVITANLPATIRITADAPVKHTLRPD